MIEFKYSQFEIWKNQKVIQKAPSSDYELRRSFAPENEVVLTNLPIPP